MKNIKKIRQEIKRLKKILEESTYYLDNSQQALGYSFALDDFKEFIDSLPEEEPSNPKGNLDPFELGLTKEGQELWTEDMKSTARHFFNLGVEWQKEQMMKEAVEGVVYRYESYQRIATAIIVDIPREILGNKVKLIIVKK